jgi:hypothetical protein
MICARWAVVADSRLALRRAACFISELTFIAPRVAIATAQKLVKCGDAGPLRRQNFNVALRDQFLFAGAIAEKAPDPISPREGPP